MWKIITTIIYCRNDKQKILTGFDYSGPNLEECTCSNLNAAKNMNFLNLLNIKIVQIYCFKRKKFWLKYIPDCSHAIISESTSLIYQKNNKIKYQNYIDILGPDLYYDNCKDINDITKPKLVLFLRGHIRNCFNNNKMKIFVLLNQLFNLKIILQTWQNSECDNKNTWRNDSKNSL